MPRQIRLISTVSPTRYYGLGSDFYIVGQVSDAAHEPYWFFILSRCMELSPRCVIGDEMEFDKDCNLFYVCDIYVITCIVKLIQH